MPPYNQLYNQLTLAERETISLLHKRRSMAAIGLILGRSRATIKREIDRNGYLDAQGELHYDWQRAHALSVSRKNSKTYGKRIRGVYRKDRFFPKLWNSPDVPYTPQVGRLRFKAWYEFADKKHYRYWTFNPWWPARYNSAGTTNSRFRPVQLVREDDRRNRKRFLFDYWSAPSLQQDDRKRRPRYKSWFVASFKNDSRKRLKSRPVFIPDPIWEGVEPFFYETREESRKEIQAVARPSLFNQEHFKSIFIEAFQKEGKAIEGRGTSKAQVFERKFKNEPVF